MSRATVRFLQLLGLGFNVLLVAVITITLAKGGWNFLPAVMLICAVAGIVITVVNLTKASN